MPEKLTEPQKRALRAVARESVSWSKITLSYWDHHARKYMRLDTMTALKGRGLFHEAADGVLELTDRGREVLRDA